MLGMLKNAAQQGSANCIQHSLACICVACVSVSLAKCILFHMHFFIIYLIHTFFVKFVTVHVNPFSQILENLPYRYWKISGPH